MTVSYGLCLTWMESILDGLGSRGDEGQAQLQSQNWEPVPVPDLLPGARIFFQPEAVFDQIAEGTSPQSLRGPEWVLFLKPFLGARVQLKEQKTMATIQAGILGEAHITPHPYHHYSSYAESHGTPSGTLPMF